MWRRSSSLVQKLSKAWSQYGRWNTGVASTTVESNRDQIPSCSPIFSRALIGISNNTVNELISTPSRAYLLQQLRGARVNGSEIRAGNIIERKGKLHQVVKTQHTQQGRGGATIQVELRDLRTGLKSTERMRTTENIERVYVDDKPFTFLYKEDEKIVLMEPTSFEQVTVPVSFFGDSAIYLQDGMPVSVHYFNGEALSASVPSRVTCTVTEAEPYFKGQAVTAAYKKVNLDNGLTVQVPSFVVTGDQIVVETSDNSYVTRAKGE